MNNSAPTTLSKIRLVNSIWKSFKPIKSPIIVSRNRSPLDYYSKLTTELEYSRIIKKETNTMKKFVEFGKTYAIVNGLEMEEHKEHMIENGQALFLEIVRAVSRNDFSQIEQYVLGGPKTLQLHRRIAANVCGTMPSISRHDFIGEDGYLINDFPKGIERNGLVRFLHDARFVSEDANGESTPALLKYTLIMGAVRSQLDLLKSLDPGAAARFVFVEMDICQRVAKPTLPIRLEEERMLYDFHLFYI